MGRESEKQIVKTQILEDVAKMFQTSIATFEQAIAIAKNNGLLEIEVRHLPKGTAAIKDLLEFSSTLQVTVSKAILPTQTQAYELMQPQIAKVAEDKPKLSSKAGSKRPGKQGS
jgi:hypothetical protein